MVRVLAFGFPSPVERTMSSAHASFSSNSPSSTRASGVGLLSTTCASETMPEHPNHPHGPHEGLHLKFRDCVIATCVSDQQVSKIR